MTKTPQKYDDIRATRPLIIRRFQAICACLAGAIVAIYFGYLFFISDISEASFASSVVSVVLLTFLINGSAYLYLLLARKKEQALEQTQQKVGPEL